MEQAPQFPPMTDSDFINVLGAFAFALQAAMPRSQQVHFHSMLGAVATQAREQQMQTVAAVLDQIQAAVPAPDAESGTNEPRH